MPAEPQVKRTIAFVDGQNLFYGAKTAFGYTYPNYDVLALATAIAQKQHWKLIQTRFYTGTPDSMDDPNWHHFWMAKLAQMGREGVYTFCRSLRYRLQSVRLPDGSTQSAFVGQEKGVDVRLAIDVISLAHQNAFDVALLFSQDQDLSEVADENPHHYETTEPLDKNRLCLCG